MAEMRLFIVSYFLIYLFVIQYSDGGSITWYEPLPVKTVSSAGDDQAPAEMKLLEGYPASLSWNFSLTSVNLFAVSIKFVTAELAFSGPGGSAAQVRDAYKDEFNFTWISQRLTLVIFNVTAAYDERIGKFSCQLTTAEGGWIRKIQVKIVERPQVVDMTSDQYVHEHSEVTLSCNATGRPEPNITWTRVWENGTDSEALQFEDGYLVMANISRSSNGTYRCTAFNGVGEPVNQTVTVIVRYPPSITYIMNDTTFNENDRVTLDCQADGNPMPTIRWIFVNDSSYVPGLFYITGKQNEGFYRCIAENSVGRDESTRDVYITVFFSPRITTASDNQTLTEGSSLILFCNTTGKPAPSITWTRVLDDGNDGEVLFVGNPWIITNVTKNFIGTYRCAANNGIGTPVNRTVYVGVFFKPSDVTLETNTTENNDCVDLWVNFICNTNTANPPVHHYLLLKNESEVSFSATGTWIEKISQGTTFVYSCITYQQVENVTSRNNVTLTVNVPPAVEQVQNATVKEGRDVTKECNVTTGTPPLTVFWENVKSGQITTGKLLNITNITRYQTEYRCVANNTCGRVLTTMFIDVQYKPSASQSSSTIKLELGEDSSIGCPVDIGNPPAVITWYSGNDTTSKKINTSSTLDVQNAAFRDEGWYTCYANNELGNTTVSLLLLVVQTVSSTVATSSQTTPAASGGTEVYLTATIQENCSRRSEVAAKFPEMACQIAFRFGCSSANTVNTRCGSVVLDFMMRFNQSVFVSNVLTVLSDAARQDKFGGFKVNPDSIKQVFIPTDGSESTTKGPEECNCPSNNVLLAIIGVLAFTILLLIIYIIWLHRKGAVGKQRTDKDERGVYDNELELEDFEPSQPDSRNLRQPSTEYMDLIVSKDNRKAQSADLGADYAPLYPLTRSWEVARSHLTIEKIIGKGAFGQVAKGTAVGLRGRPETTTVAIKMLKTNAAESDKRDLMKELDTMKQLKPHPYVIKLLGCVTESEPLLVLIEYVPFGDLLGYLRKSRGLKDTYFKDPDIKPQTNLTSQQLMRFAWQIADGMSYLSAKSAKAETGMKRILQDIQPNLVYNKYPFSCQGRKGI